MLWDPHTPLPALDGSTSNHSSSTRLAGELDDDCCWTACRGTASFPSTPRGEGGGPGLGAGGLGGLAQVESTSSGGSTPPPLHSCSWLGASLPSSCLTPVNIRPHSSSSFESLGNMSEVANLSISLDQMAPCAWLESPVLELPPHWGCCSAPSYAADDDQPAPLLRGLPAEWQLEPSHSLLASGDLTDEDQLQICSAFMEESSSGLEDCMQLGGAESMLVVEPGVLLELSPAPSSHMMLGSSLAATFSAMSLPGTPCNLVLPPATPTPSASMAPLFEPTPLSIAHKHRHRSARPGKHQQLTGSSGGSVHAHAAALRLPSAALKARAGASRSGTRGTVDLQQLEQEGLLDMPLSDAAQRLGVQETALKKMSRAAGLPRWPFRMRESLNTLEERLHKLLPGSPPAARAAVLGFLAAERERIVTDPSALLSGGVVLLRQRVFKLEHQQRSKTAPEPHAALELLTRGIISLGPHN